MENENRIEYRVWGRYALFTDPLTKIGGEKFTYQIPTYQALKGVTESIYWKPTIQWYIDEVRIMRPIRTQPQGIRPIHYQDGKNDLSVYTYLKDVEYQVRAHFEWNENRPDLALDHNENKHYFIAKRMAERGGRRDIFLGTRECQAYVAPCKFGEGRGAYDGVGMTFGLMVHGLTYPDEAYDERTKGRLSVRFWTPEMEDGRIVFPRPEKCTIVRTLGKRSMKAFKEGNFSGTGEFERGGVWNGLD